MNVAAYQDKEKNEKTGKRWAGEERRQETDFKEAACFPSAVVQGQHGDEIVGVLYLTGVCRCQHESLCSLWSPGLSERAICFASFDRNRFEQLIAYLRFDS